MFDQDITITSRSIEQIQMFPISLMPADWSHLIVRVTRLSRALESASLWRLSFDKATTGSMKIM